MTWTSGGNSRTSSPAWRQLRRTAITTYGNHCNNCGADGRTTRLELDHIIPVAEGGQDTLDNAQLLCTVCHTPKTQAEAARGRARRSGRRQPRRHPADNLTTPTPGDPDPAHTEHGWLRARLSVRIGNPGGSANYVHPTRAIWKA